MRTLCDDEILQLQDWRLREFCRRALDGMPDLYFELPASKSGKYHPIQNLGSGGLVRHTKIAAYFSRRFAKVYQLDLETEDIIAAAAILHDLGKTWENRDLEYVPHEILGAEYLKKLPESYRFAQVIEAVRWHMGPWRHGRPDFLALNPICQVTHLGDYAAAQKSLLVDFLPIDPEVMVRKAWNDII